jgi:metal-sulfur cluster biosynthetic enzyme
MLSSFFKTKSIPEISKKTIETAIEATEENSTNLEEILEWKDFAFDQIRNIRDPEKPDTLEDLQVVQEDLIEIKSVKSGHYTIKICIVPTVPHCSLATLIGLCIRTKLERELPVGKFKIDLTIKVNLKSLLNKSCQMSIDDILTFVYCKIEQETCNRSFKTELIYWSYSLKIRYLDGHVI